MCVRLEAANLLGYRCCHAAGAGADSPQCAKTGIFQPGRIAHMREREQIGRCLDLGREKAATYSPTYVRIIRAVKEDLPWSEIRIQTLLSLATTVARTGGRTSAVGCLRRVARNAWWDVSDGMGTLASQRSQRHSHSSRARI